MNTCKRCWKEIKKSDLRCKECRKLVDEEVIEKSVSRPLAFYFSDYYRYWYPKKK